MPSVVMRRIFDTPSINNVQMNKMKVRKMCVAWNPQIGSQMVHLGPFTMTELIYLEE